MREGLIVHGVVGGSAADRAGLARFVGRRLTHVDGVAVQDQADVRKGGGVTRLALRFAERTCDDVLSDGATVLSSPIVTPRLEGPVWPPVPPDRRESSRRGSRPPRPNGPAESSSSQRLPTQATTHSSQVRQLSGVGLPTPRGSNARPRRQSLELRTAREHIAALEREVEALRSEVSAERDPASQLSLLKSLADLQQELLQASEALDEANAKRVQKQLALDSGDPRRISTSTTSSRRRSSVVS
eukprot:TRINITY_DN34063_c0_g1_i1.p2 TRINITY_DN34063_c0_g1~~TRINITY_DN34063_c0_g1_i1.p2  ORF type:complete len:243 (+),score=82.11 TRINITY_DN34063_c0_g1_i1:548-1276(+)